VRNKFFQPLHDYKPAYLELYASGELQERVREALRRLAHCQICPRSCGVDRAAGERGVCRIGRLAQVSSHFGHFAEEKCLSGRGGSGTIFFAQCNLRCVFCQNYDISQDRFFPETQKEHLAKMMLDLQARGCHNINLVTPSHVVPQIMEALVCAIGLGLSLPLVYNTSSYDSLETLRLLDGIVDIYLPDFKMWDEDATEKYLLARDYPEAARAALREMHRQVGVLKLDENGIAKRGVLVRHLVMPNNFAGTPSVAAFLAREVSVDTYINLMAQYHPAGKVNRKEYGEIDRRITQQEYFDAMQAAREEGLYRFD